MIDLREFEKILREVFPNIRSVLVATPAKHAESVERMTPDLPKREFIPDTTWPKTPATRRHTGTTLAAYNFLICSVPGET